MPLIRDDTTLDCGIVLTVACYRNGKHYERANYYPAKLVTGQTLSVVGTELQRQVFESLRLAYYKAYNNIQTDLPGEQVFLDT